MAHERARENEEYLQRGAKCFFTFFTSRVVSRAFDSTISSRERA
jgi:hypothetical protein